MTTPGADLRIQVCHCQKCQSSSSPVGRIVDSAGFVARVFVDAQDAWRQLADLRGFERLGPSDFYRLWEEVLGANPLFLPKQEESERREAHQHLTRRCEGERERFMGGG